jgi:hypothetical protein
VPDESVQDTKEVPKVEETKTQITEKKAKKSVTF